MPKMFKKFMRWVNPWYVGTGVLLCIIGGMLLQVNPMNDRCNRFLVHNHAVISSQIHHEHRAIFHLRDHDQAYHYADLTDKMNNAQQIANRLKAKQRTRRSKKAKPSSSKIKAKKIRAQKMKARLQIVVGQHDLYLLRHPELKQKFQDRRLRMKLTESYTRSHTRRNKLAIAGFKKDIRQQKQALKRNRKHYPTTNAFHQAYNNKVFNKLSSWIASIILIGFITFCILLKGLGYKASQIKLAKERKRVAEKKHIIHLYGDDNPEEDENQ